ncbi:MAG: ADP-ribosylglycohydrolase family protein [Limnochordia bacterium]
MTLVLDFARYKDKVYACWLGKNIGGTLGTPYECRKYVNNLTYYDPVPEEPLPNDDLDLQLVWLKLVEDKGLPPSLSDFAAYWQQYLKVYPWNEYGFCIRNLTRGLRPPISGWFENYYVDEMGSPIRSEIWACLAPANPQRAAALAWLDSAMDHAGGEGMWGEMFWAAVESAAFVVSDPLQLIDIGLAMIPPSCNISRVIREAVWCWQNGQRWAEARDRVVRIYGNNQPCNAVQNHGFTIIGWLYGNDFGDKLCKAVNCGYDTDCTGATLGATLGIIGGTAGIPEEWSKPVGDRIVLHKFTGAFNAPQTIQELTDRVVALTERYQEPEVVRFGTADSLPADLLGRLYRNAEAVAAQKRDIRAAVALSGDMEIILHYNGDPVLRPQVARRFQVTCKQNGIAVNASVSLEAPAEWRVVPVENTTIPSFDVTADNTQETAWLQVNVQKDGKEYTASFAVLGIKGTQGYPSATNIPKCPTCYGNKQSCLCAK